MNRNFPTILVSILLLILTSAIATAQHPSSIATNVSVSTETRALLSQEVLATLATLPEADTLVFINPKRIINEVVPRLMPEKDQANLRKGFGEMKQFAGVDPTQLDFVVIAVRFRKPTADLMFAPPEFMAVTGGDFSSEGLVALARAASQGKLRDEKYGEKTLSLMTIDPIAKESEKNPFLKSFSEVGVVPLSGNLLAVGSPGYLRAAVDAAAGKGRITVENLNSLLRDPSVLASAAGSPWDSFAKSLGLFGTEANARAPKCESNLGDFYVALTMDATNFMLRGAMGADNPDTAKILNNLANGFLRHATSYAPDKTRQNVMSSLKLTATDNEVVLNADIPQQMVLDFIKSQSKPKKEEAAATSNPSAKKPVVRRKRRRPRQ